MTVLVKSLSAAQQDQLAVYRDKWMAVGLSTEPADRAVAEAGVREAYAAAGKAAPKIFVWLDSPYRGAIGAAILAQVRAQVGDQVRAQVRDQVWDQVGDQVWDQVWDQVGDQVRAQVRDQVGDQVGDQVRAQVRAQVWDQVRAQVRAQVWDQVRDQVWDQVRAQVWDQVGDQVRDQVWDQVNKCCYGQHDANWLGFYNFFREQCGLEITKKLTGMDAVASAAGWWWPFENAVLLTNRPAELHRDDQGRLHNETGPAMLYRDGWGLFYIHGVAVPEWIITKPELITTEGIDRETNAEIRRIMTERFPGGIGAYLHTTGAKVVDFDQVEVVRGSGAFMPRALLKDKHGNQFLEGTDGSTERSYFMSVSPNVRTCRTAHLSISGLDERRCVAQS